jgi:hypothetical protein
LIDHLILHIGIYKTGTTSLQAIFGGNRKTLLDNGVYYPDYGINNHLTLAASVMQKSWGWTDRGETSFSPSYWNDFVKELRKRDGTVIVSSEFFCQADDEQVAKIKASLPNCKISIVVGLRPLNELLWSTYQQFIKFGRRYSVEKWVKSVFNDFDNGDFNSGFWLRNHQENLINRWSNQFGFENINIVVSDPTKPSLAFDLIMKLANISHVKLEVESEQLLMNRSMTVVETEAIRRINIALHKKIVWPEYRQTIRRGAIERLVELRDPPSNEARSAIPAWASLRAAEIQNSWEAKFSTSDYKVIPSWDRLRVDSPATDSVVTDLAYVPMDLLENIAVGIVSGVTSGSYNFKDQDTKYFLNARSMKFPTLIRYVISRMSETISRIAGR